MDEWPRYFGHPAKLRSFLNSEIGFCEADPKRVRTGFLLAFEHLLKTGDCTPDELAKIFRISRPTVYRIINDRN